MKLIEARSLIDGYLIPDHPDLVRFSKGDRLVLKDVVFHEFEKRGFVEEIKPKKKAKPKAKTKKAKPPENKKMETVANEDK